MDMFFFQILIIVSVFVFVFPKRLMFYFALPLQAAIIGITSYWAAKVLFGGSIFEQTLLLEFWGDPLKITIDNLSAFFILVTNFTMLTGLLYSKGYLKPYLENKNNAEFGLHYFNYIGLHISMLLVCMIRDALAFMVVWELMSISSFFLVAFESEKKETIKIGVNYLVQMHIGLVFIMAGFIYAFAQTGASFSFDGLAEYFAAYNSFPLFLVFFIGFGIKAGFIPFHTWLPHAHPAAPSHVSGVMSGVMIKMGIYGILRVLTYVHTELLTIGIFIIAVSLISGLMGIMHAIIQRDIKKMLAYSSIENIGIIGIGIGIGVLGIAKDMPMLAALGFAGGILHILNHSLFKSLLFYSAGSVYLKNHTRNMDQLGGLIKKMPKTAVFFLLGALAICGLPPFNGFISEFLIYSGLFKSLLAGGIKSDLLFLASFVGLALIGGLAIFCFTKCFSIIFLGTPRSDLPSHANEVTISMIFPKTLIITAILGIGLYPAFFLKAVSNVVKLYVQEISWLAPNTAVLSQASMVSMVFIATVIFMWLFREIHQKKMPVEYGPTWGCSYTGADPALHQYTATSFAYNYCELASPLLKVKTDYTPLAEEEIFPQPRKFQTHTTDLFEDKLINNPLNNIIPRMEKAAIFQSGKLQHYIMYAFAFLMLIFLLTILGVI